MASSCCSPTLTLDLKTGRSEEAGSDGGGGGGDAEEVPPFLFFAPAAAGGIAGWFCVDFLLLIHPSISLARVKVRPLFAVQVQVLAGSVA